MIDTDNKQSDAGDISGENLWLRSAIAACGRRGKGTVDRPDYSKRELIIIAGGDNTAAYLAEDVVTEALNKPGYNGEISNHPYTITPLALRARDTYNVSQHSVAFDSEKGVHVPIKDGQVVAIDAGAANSLIEKELEERGVKFVFARADLNNSQDVAKIHLKATQEFSSERLSATLPSKPLFGRSRAATAVLTAS